MTYNIFIVICSKTKALNISYNYFDISRAMISSMYCPKNDIFYIITNLPLFNKRLKIKWIKKKASKS